MSRFRNEVAHLNGHVRTLRFCLAGTMFLAAISGYGWWSAPRDLTIHVPPDLRSGSVRRWWDVPPESVYAFTFYVFQQLHRWSADGEADYARNIRSLSAYFTPACKAFLERDFAVRRERGELRRRVRGVYEIPGRGFGNDPLSRVKSVSDREWIVTLDLMADEYYSDEPVKRAGVRYPINVVRFDVDPKMNPFGLVLDCFSSPPQRIALPSPSPASASDQASGKAGATP